MLPVRPQVVILRKEHPSWVLEQIAREVNVSRERVRQILETEGLPTRHPKKVRLCKICGNPTRNANKYCDACYISWKASCWIEVTCNQCGKPKYRLISQYREARPHFCDNKCKARYVFNKFWEGHCRLLVCNRCGRTFSRTLSEIRPNQQHFYCSSKCNYGALRNS